MKVQVEIVGTDRVQATLHAVMRKATRIVPRNLYRYAQRSTLPKAIEYCPIKTGAVRSSGKVELVGDTVEISFGGMIAPYAVYVHEIMTNHHPVGQAKFLERAVTEDAKALAQEAAKDITTP